VEAGRHFFAKSDEEIDMNTSPAGKNANRCCDGKVVKIAGDKLTCTCAKGDDHHYTIAKDAPVTCDGDKGNLSDLKQGSTIRMTMCKDDDQKVIAVDCGTHIPALAV